MADPHTSSAAPPLPPLDRPPSVSVQVPLLLAATANNANHRTHSNPDDTDLDQTLQKLETFLTFLGFNQSSVLGFLLSWTVFLLIGVALPVIVLEFSNCSDSEEYQIIDFELVIVASQACLAAVSLLCLSHNLRKYGIRKFLFVNRYSGQMSRFRDEYIKQIKVRSMCSSDTVKI